MSIQETITQRIIDALDRGVIPWRKEWNDASPLQMPRNFVSQKPYRGINVWLLAVSDFTSPYWLTYKQATDKGGHVRKGEKGTKIVYWNTSVKTIEEPGSEPEARRVAFAREYTVFNLDQCEGLKSEPSEPSGDTPAINPIDTAEAISTNYFKSNSSLSHYGNRAFYRPLTDAVVMPALQQFKSAEGYYSTLFHEMTHSTGHSKRLARGLDTDTASFGSEVYSKEELVAEFGAAFLCAEAGISNESLIENHTAYIQSWLRALKNDKTLAMSAAQKAQRAADFILNRSFDESEVN